MDFFDKYEASLYEQIPQSLRAFKPNLLQKSIFIHIPKTGGTFIREHFNEQPDWWTMLGIGHGNLEDFPEYEDRFSFTFVREPEQWLISSWGFQRRVLEKNNTFEFQKEWSEKAVADKVFWNEWEQITNPVQALWHEDFDNFLNRIQEHAPNIIDLCFRHFTRGVDFIGKTENLESDLIEALELAGEDMDFYKPEIIRSWSDDKRNATKRPDNFSYNKSLMGSILDRNPYSRGLYE